MKQLDQIDRQILWELDKNSRIPLTVLSKRLKISRDRTDYRIKRLKDEGVLRSFSATINPYKLGLVVYKTYVRLERDPVRVAAFQAALAKERRIYWFGECDGGCDFIFAAYSRSPQEFSRLQDEIFSQFEDIILEFSVYTLVEAVFYRKHYLVGAGSDSFSIGGAPAFSELDKTDKKILSALSENCRLSLKELRTIVDAAPLTVANRIKKLEQHGILVGYRVDLDLSKLGMSVFKAQIFLNDFSVTSLQRLEEFSRANPYVTYVIRQLGDCKLELEFEVESYDQYILLIDDLRERFSKTIRSIDTVRIKNQSYRWVPDESFGASNNA